MSINFFKEECKEPAITARSFGLCDHQDGSKAYTNIDNPDVWIATVQNEQGKEVIFTAIDGCVIMGNEEMGRSRCDVMLTTGNDLYFIELKDQNAGWMPKAIEQLASTIQFFAENHNIEVYKTKKAFACNRQHRHFQEIDNETTLRFFRDNHHFRLDIQARVVIV